MHQESGVDSHPMGRSIQTSDRATMSWAVKITTGFIRIPPIEISEKWCDVSGAVARVAHSEIRIVPQSHLQNPPLKRMRRGAAILNIAMTATKES